MEVLRAGTPPISSPLMPTSSGCTVERKHMLDLIFDIEYFWLKIYTRGWGIDYTQI
jgi:hypothetical protein